MGRTSGWKIVTTIARPRFRRHRRKTAHAQAERGRPAFLGRNDVRAVGITGRNNAAAAPDFGVQRRKPKAAGCADETCEFPLNVIVSDWRFLAHTPDTRNHRRWVNSVRTTTGDKR